jgi:hypothetical protein
MKHRPVLVALQSLLLGYALPSDGSAQAGSVQSDQVQISNCDYSAVPGVIWYGVERQMTIQRFAAYAAPIFWFSMNEPSMNYRRGKQVRGKSLMIGIAIKAESGTARPFCEALVGEPAVA